MVKVLSIGNSFSEDAQRYLYAIAKANGESIKNVNLYIGGCELRTHYNNAVDDKDAYDYQYKGERVGLSSSIKKALLSDEWDYVTVQQASHKSFEFDSYNPYLERLCEYIDKYAPKAKIIMHRTWAYPDYSAETKGFKDAEEMYEAVSKSYDKAMELIKVDGIYSGDAMIKAYRADREIVHRDPIHASLGFGRYMLGIVWFRYFFGEKESFVHITEFDEPVTDEQKELAYNIAYN